MSDYVDEYGKHHGYCNDCGEEAALDSECCDTGEVVPYDDDPNPYDETGDSA